MRVLTSQPNERSSPRPPIVLHLRRPPHHRFRYWLFRELSVPNFLLRYWDGLVTGGLNHHTTQSALEIAMTCVPRFRS